MLHPWTTHVQHCTPLVYQGFSCAIFFPPDSSCAQAAACKCWFAATVTEGNAIALPGVPPPPDRFCKCRPVAAISAAVADASNMPHARAVGVSGALLWHRK